MCLSSNTLDQLHNHELTPCFPEELSQANLAPNWQTGEEVRQGAKWRWVYA